MKQYFTLDVILFTIASAILIIIGNNLLLGILLIIASILLLYKMTEEKRSRIIEDGGVISGIGILLYFIGGIFGFGVAILCILPILWIKVFIIEAPMLLTGFGICIFFGILFLSTKYI